MCIHAYSHSHCNESPTLFWDLPWNDIHKWVRKWWSLRYVNSRVRDIWMTEFVTNESHCMYEHINDRVRDIDAEFVTNESRRMYEHYNTSARNQNQRHSRRYQLIRWDAFVTNSIIRISEYIVTMSLIASEGIYGVRYSDDGHRDMTHPHVRHTCHELYNVSVTNWHTLIHIFRW